MANVNVRFSATIIDGLSTEKSALAYGVYSDTVTLGGIVADMTTWVTDLDAVTDGIITGNRVHITPTLVGGIKTDRTTTAFKASRVEQTGVLNFTTAASSHRFGQVIPALAAAVISAGKVDLTAGAVTVLIGLITNGQFTNSATQVLSALSDAIISYRESRRQLQRSSFEV